MLSPLIQKIINFNTARDWDQFHKPKDLAISLALEAAEVLEHVQWKSDEQFAEYLNTNKEAFGDELADVFIYLLQLANKTDIDILEAAERKMEKNEKKYPVEKARGKADKYTEL